MKSSHPLMALINQKAVVNLVYVTKEFAKRTPWCNVAAVFRLQTRTSPSPPDSK